MSETARVFDDLAEKYDSWYDRNQKLFEVEAETVPPPLSPSIEVGCGSGRFMQKLSIDVGVDISVRLLRIASRRGCKVVLADGAALPFPAEVFSSAYLIFTLCFLTAPEDVLKEVWRVLRPGGVLVTCIIPLDSGLGREYSSKNNPFYRIARFYRLDEARLMIEKSGFSITEVRGVRLKHSDDDFVCITSMKAEDG